MAKKPLVEEEKKMSGWLYGWKEIAGYLGCSTQTAKLYHKKFSLPIKRSPLGKPMTQPRKVDDWLEKEWFKTKML